MTIANKILNIFLIIQTGVSFYSMYREENMMAITSFLSIITIILLTHQITDNPKKSKETNNSEDKDN